MPNKYQILSKYRAITLLGSPYLKAYGRHNESFVMGRCDCGQIKEFRLNNLNRGKTNSCGCLMRKGRTRKHGASNHPLYPAWAAMIRRCYSKKHKSYQFYGGAGISVCDEWRSEPNSYIKWCLDNKWVPGLEVDRYPNSRGNYEPSNCRIVTHAENLRNRNYQ